MAERTGKEEEQDAEPRPAGEEAAFELASATWPRSRFVAVGAAEDGIMKVRFLDTLKANIPPEEDWIQYLRRALPDLMAGSGIAHWWLYECSPVLLAKGGTQCPKSPDLAQT